MKRAFDLILALIAALLLILPILIVAMLVRLTSPGPIVYWSDRVGRRNRIFKMPKFRSMRIDTPAVATHLLENPSQWLTPIGAFLRKSSLDELPQLWTPIMPRQPAKAPITQKGTIRENSGNCRPTMAPST